MQRIRTLSKKIHKPAIFLYFKYGLCFIIKGFGLCDYFEYELYDKKLKEIKEYVSTKEEYTFYSKYSPYSKNEELNIKPIFMNKYKKYTKRSFLRINEDNFDEFEKFFNSHDQIMIKANEDSGGTGIEKINTSDYDVKELFDKLLNNNSFVEEVIKQDDRMAALMPNSINTIRIMTKNFDGNPQVLFACVRCGRGACVDNFHSGGMGSNINIDTGIVYTKAVDKDNNRYDKHPVTGVEFVGFEIPMWKEICEICKEAHKITPNSKVVGWDVAISKDGPCLVEGNNSPGWDLIQTAEKKGLYYIFRQLLNDAENVK